MVDNQALEVNHQVTGFSQQKIHLVDGMPSCSFTKFTRKSEKDLKLIK